MEWKPIETAPRDGSVILASNSHGVWITKYEKTYTSGYEPENPWFSLMLNHRHMATNASLVPTHWMPLPDPSKQ